MVVSVEEVHVRVKLVAVITAVWSVIWTGVECSAVLWCGQVCTVQTMWCSMGKDSMPRDAEERGKKREKEMIIKLTALDAHTVLRKELGWGPKMVAVCLVCY